jgi:phytoene dehydrogenase-like protein
VGGHVAEVVANEAAVSPGEDASATVHACRTAIHSPDRAIRAGFRERVICTAVRSPSQMAEQNTNYVGGDTIGGAYSAGELLFRPRFARDPYFTGGPGTYLCSASTPPGAGAHGMCGANAAERALAKLARAR